MRPEAGGFGLEAGRPWLAALLLLLLASGARAQLTFNYVTFPNNGNAGPRTDRNLPSFTINVTSPAATDFPARVELVRQDSGNITPTFFTNGGQTPTGDLTNVLFEGRNQILGHAIGNTGNLSNVPATFPSGLPLVVDVNTGPPNNPNVDTITTAGNVTRTSPFSALVTFNRISPSFTVALAGRVLNMPTPPNPPAQLGEVEAQVSVTVRAVRFSPRIRAPLVPSLATFTQPVTRAFTFPVPAFTGTLGGWTLPTQNFAGQDSGIYEIRMTARDVANQASPQTTASTITVNLDTIAPFVTVTFPPTRTFIIDGPAPPAGVTGDRFTLTGVVSDERQQGTTVTIAVFRPGSAAPQLVTTVPSQAGPAGTWALPLDFRPGGVIVPVQVPQDIRRIEIQSTDLAGNPSPVTTQYIIHDLVAPSVPGITFPLAGQGVSSPTITFQGTITNVLPGRTTEEEHGGVRVRLTVTSTNNPSITAVVEAPAAPSGGSHDSDLDDTPGFAFPLDVLGNIPDAFAFAIPMNLQGFPAGPVNVVARAIDGVGNTSAAAAPLTFFVGPSGPATRLDFASSGPDDNTQFLGTRTNQRGADDGDLDGVPGFFVTLKSPERLDVGNPPSAPRPPFFNGGTDPGNTSAVILSGSASDVGTPVVRVTASGPGVPTTSFAPSPGITVTFALPVDIRGLPEGVPTQINVNATNSDGTTGASTSVVVFRDIVPPRAPRVTFPPLLTCLFGSATIPCFFAGNTAQVVEGVAEPNALVVLSTPPTLGIVSPPIPRTSNTAVPNPASALSSLPANAQLARADASGVFRFNSVNFSTVATSITQPVPVILQAVDSFDNTDPVSSALAVGVFRLDQAGEVVRVRLDPTLRNFQVFPGTPAAPVVQQFFGRERIQIEVTFSTVIAQAPVLTVRQTGTVAAAATLVSPARPTPLSTQVLVYEYRAPSVTGLFDGPAAISLSGGRDVFGVIPNAFNLSRALFIDSVAPVPAVTGAADFVPPTGTAVPTIAQVAVGVEDRRAGNGSVEASCVSTSFTRIRLFGPLETAPNNEVALTEPPPPATSQPVLVPCGPVTVTRVPVAQPAQEGTYEIRAEIGDNVGNVARFTSTFVLDRSPIGRAFIVCNPAHRSAVTTLPRFGTRQAVFVTVTDGNVDLVRSSASLSNPNGASIGQTSIGTGTNQLVVPLASPLPGNGRSDGRYRIQADIVDRAGNASPRTTCEFILDTLPPQILAVFPLFCAGPPLRYVQAEVVDQVPNNGFPPAFSGLDRSRTDLKLRLIVPDPLNKTLPGTEIKGIKKYRTSTGPFDIIAFEFVDPGGNTRALADDGREDGRYQLEVSAADLAGNVTTTNATFEYDSQPPGVTLTNFPEGSFLADTLLLFGGGAFDQGCGLLQGATAGSLSTGTVQVSIRRVDPQGREVLPIVAPFFDYRNVTQIQRRVPPAPFVKDDSEWVFSGLIPNAPGRARLSVRAIDRAGNVRTITREITINGGPLRAPVHVAPPDGSVTGDKTVVFEWLPVTQADNYDLVLTRVTPPELTTTVTFSNIRFPFNEFKNPLVNGVRQPVDLTDFAAQVPGGAPISTESIFSWQIRSNDVSQNPGPLSTPTTFVVDPTPPGIGTVRFGLSTANPPVVGAGETLVIIEFAEPAGMDISKPIEVLAQPRDPAIPPIKLEQLAYTPARWVGLLTLPLPGDNRDLNGPAFLLVRGAVNRAGKPLTDVRVPFVINLGPFFQVRFFSNPVIPEELELVIKATASSASNTGISLEGPPVVRITQHGHIVPAPVTVETISGPGIPQSSTFRGFFRVDPKLIGHIDFAITGTEAGGATTTRGFGVTVAGALVLGGVRFPLVVPHAQGQLAPGGLPPAGMLLGVASEQAPPGARDAVMARAADRGLVPVGEIGYVFPDGRELAAPLSVTLPLASLAVPQGVKPEQVGLYRAAPGGDPEWIGGLANPAELSASTHRLGFLGVFADTAPPVVGAIDPAPDARLEQSRPVVRAALTDRASGVAAASVVVDGEVHAARWDPAAGEALWTAERPLKPGKHELEVRARDRAGNEVRSARFAVTVLGPIGFTQAVAVPNPVARPPARIRYLLTRPAARVKAAIYDVAGRRLISLEGPGAAGANTLEWDLETRDGNGVGNGVYLFTMEAEDGAGGRAKTRGKIAVLR